MAVSTTATFSLDIDDLLDAAFRRIYDKSPSGYDISAGRRALALLFHTLTLKNICLWQIAQATPISLTQDLGTYALPADTVEVLEMTVRDVSQLRPQDLRVERISRDLYAYTSDKATASQPTQAYVHKGRDELTLYLYPVPDRATWEFRYWRIVRPRDPGALTNGADAPVKWQPALISGLAWFLARESSKVSLDLRAQLKAEWDEDFAEAANEDRDPAAIILDADLTPYSRPYG